MILIESVYPEPMEQIKRVFTPIHIQYPDFELVQESRIFTKSEVQLLPIRQEFWMNDDKNTGVELAMTRQIKQLDAVFPFGEIGKSKARVGPNDISYIKTRF